MNAATSGAPPTVDIVCSTFDGERFLGSFLDSLLAQTHGQWRLWIRDDGSRDGTRNIIRDFERRDTRIRLIAADGETVGAVRSFAWLLEHLAPETRYALCADQDDVWLPQKIETTLSVMQRAELARPGPQLVHSDLQVVDEQLRPIADSAWTFQAIDPEPATLERVVVQGLVTGATLMVNRDLLDLALPIPSAAIFHDWWLACVAAATGELHAIRTPTVLYRQHGTNVVGARAPTYAVPWLEFPRYLIRAWRNRAVVRASVDDSSRQAEELLRRVSRNLSAEGRRFLTGYAHIHTAGLFRRKWNILRFRVRPEHGLLRSIGVVVRG